MSEQGGIHAEKGSKIIGAAGRDFKGDNFKVTINESPASEHLSQLGIEELLGELKEAIATSPDLDEKRKAKALEQVEALVLAAQNPTDEEMKESAFDAKTMLDGIISKLPAAAALVTVCEKVLPLIAKFFGL